MIPIITLAGALGTLLGLTGVIVGALTRKTKIIYISISLTLTGILLTTIATSVGNIITATNH